VIDYAPERFNRRFTAIAVLRLDRWCCYRSDAVWNVSAAMEGARLEHGSKPERCAPQIEVPLGSRYHEIPKPAPGERRENLVVFLGSLTREQGLHLMVEAMPAIRDRIPQARLRVIGDGPELAVLKELTLAKHLEDSIEFLGFIEDDAKAASLVSEGVVAVAPYLRDGSSYKRFADPGKVKIYLAAGLPIVICRVLGGRTVIPEPESRSSPQRKYRRGGYSRAISAGE
jgi:glycosyltransferase involved in cell wall biosynthesis